MIKTIQMTIDQTLLEHVDRAVRELRITRSAFIRDALEQALHALEIHRRELQHKQGYEQIPVPDVTLEEWQSEQDWGAL